MQTLVTGISGYVGAALAPRLRRDGHASAASPARAARRAGRGRRPRRGRRALGRRARPRAGRGRGRLLPHPLDGGSGRPHGVRRERAPRRRPSFADAAARAGVRRIVYLGGLVPSDGAISRHLASRLAVEETLLEAAPQSIALRASIVVGARSRSFRFLVRLIERLPVLALPAWREHRTRPIDGRDVLEFLLAAATAPRRARGLVGRRRPRSHDLRGAHRAHRRRHDRAPPAGCR